MKLKYSTVLLSLSVLAFVFVFLLLRVQFHQLNDHEVQHKPLHIANGKQNIRIRRSVEDLHETSDEHGSHKNVNEVESSSVTNSSAPFVPGTVDLDQLSSSQLQSSEIKTILNETLDDIDPPAIEQPNLIVAEQPSALLLAKNVSNNLASNSTSIGGSEFNTNVEKQFLPKKFVPSSSITSRKQFGRLYELYASITKSHIEQAYEKAVSIQDVNLIENFYQALRTGKPIQYTKAAKGQFGSGSSSGTSSSTATTSSYTSYSITSYSSSSSFSAVSEVIKELKDRHLSLFIEYSNLNPCSSKSYDILHSSKDTTIILHQVTGNVESLDYSQCASRFESNSILLGISSVVNNDMSTINHHCVQYIEDLALLDIDLMSFEYESLLGKILGQCSVTYLSKSLPSLPYFLSWESMEQLVESASKTNSLIYSYNLSVAASTYFMVTVNRTSNSSRYLSWSDIKSIPLHRDSRYKISSLYSDFSIHTIDTGGGSRELYWVGNKFDSVDNISNAVYKTLKVAEGSLHSTRSSSSSSSSSSHSSNSYRYYTSYSTSSSFAIPARSPTHSPSFPPVYNTNSSSNNGGNHSIVSVRRRLSYYSTSSPREEKFGADISTTIPLSKYLLDRNQDTIYYAYKAAYDRIRKEKPKLSSSPSSSSYDYYISSTTRRLHKALLLHEKEHYDYWMKALSSSIKSLLQSGTVYIIGGKVSLLSLKFSKLLSKQHPTSQVISLLLQNQTHIHHRLSKMMSISSNLILYPTRDIPTIVGWTTLQGKGDVSIIQANSLVYILDIVQCDAKAFYEALGSLLVVSKLTYLEMIESSSWQEIVNLLFPNSCQDLHDAFNDIQNLFQSISNEIQGDVEVTNITSNNIYVVHYSQANVQEGVPVNSLVRLGIIPEQKKVLLPLLVNIPMWSHAQQSQESVAFDYSKLHSKDLMLKVDYQGRWYIDIRTNPIATSNEDPAEVELKEEYLLSKKIFNAIQEQFTANSVEVAGGKFSMVNQDSKSGMLSTMISNAYPLATMLSIAYRNNDDQTILHQEVLEGLNISSNAICVPKLSVKEIYENFYHSPELFRFQILFSSLLDQFRKTSSLSDWGDLMRHILSSSLSSFIYVPNIYLVSWAMYTLFHEIYLPSEVMIRLPLAISDNLLDYYGHSSTFEPLFLANLTSFTHLQSLASHPQHAYTDFISQWLTYKAHTDNDYSSSSFLLTPLFHNVFDIPMLRVDVVNITRHVQHHFQSQIDGHKRTYTMHISVNVTETNRVQSMLGDASKAEYSVKDNHIVLNDVLALPLGHHINHKDVSFVHLYRDKDSWPIPYTTIHGITLITALRLGLIEKQRDRLFKEFLKMPLYEDMAPWNIVLMGSSVDYIDYDTKDITFDVDVPKAYRVMSVLMNYKRTVQDFMRCGSNAPTVYGLPFISDCVGSTMSSSYGAKLSCSDLRYPVPCGDGVCHSDYISCLRSLSKMAEVLATQSEKTKESNILLRSEEEQLALTLAQAMSSVVSSFNHSSSRRTSYQEFLRVLGEERG